MLKSEYTDGVEFKFTTSAKRSITDEHKISCETRMGN